MKLKQPSTRKSRLVRKNARPIGHYISSDDESDKENINPNKMKCTTKKIVETNKIKDAEEKTCTICYDSISDCAEIDSCDHKFCVECINMWAERSSKCPVCRGVFRTIKTKNGSTRVKQKEYRHEDEDENYRLASEFIDDEEENSDDDSDLDEHGNLVGFIDYQVNSPHRRLRVRPVFECDDEEYEPSQLHSQNDEDSDDEELISTQEQHDQSIISVKSSPATPHRKRRKLDDSGYDSDATVVLDQEEIYEDVVKNLLWS